MASGTPILSLGSAYNSEVASLIEFTGTGVCLQNEISKIEKMLLNMLNREPFIDFLPNLNRIRSFSRETQARRMLEVLNNL